MIHINRNGVHTGDRTMNTICTRRHRGMMQTSFILILFVCIGYGFYLYNLLQVQMTEVDSRATRYRAQHQSLSEQLQVVYDERSQLEKSLQNEKDDHGHTKQEFMKHKEDVKTQQERKMLEHQREKENLAEENNKLKIDVNDHKEKYEGLLLEHSSVVEQHNLLQRQHVQLKVSMEEQLQNEKNNRYLLENSHQELQEQHKLVQDEAYKLQEQISGLNRLSEVNENNVALTKQQLEQQIQQNNQLHNQLKVAIETNNQETDTLTQQLNNMQGDAERYKSLENILRKVGADVVNLEHDKMKQLSPDDRKFLFEHFVGSDNAHLMEEQHVQLVKEEQERIMAVNEKERVQKLRDQELNLRQEQQQKEKEKQRQGIQELNKQESVPPQQGMQQREPTERNTVEEGESEEEVAAEEEDDQGHVLDICSLPAEVGTCGGNVQRYYFDPQLAVCRPFVYTGCQGNENNFESIEICEDTCSDDQKRYIIQESHDDVRNGNSPDSPNADEMEARSLEEQANMELQAQQHQQQQEDKDLGNIDPVEQLKELQEEQVKAAKQQEDNMNQLIEKGHKTENNHGDYDKNVLEDNNEVNDDESLIEGGAMDYENGAAERDTRVIHGEIVDENDDNNNRDNQPPESVANVAKPKEGDVQVAFPPAAQVAGDNPEEVGNIPPLNPDQEEEENQGETEQYEDYEEEEEQGPAGQKNNIQMQFPRHQLDGDADENEGYNYHDDGQDQDDDYNDGRNNNNPDDSRYPGQQEKDMHNNADKDLYNNNANVDENNSIKFPQRRNFNIRNRDF